MIKIILVKYKILSIQQKQRVQQESGATSWLPIGGSFMYNETNSSNHGNIVLFSSERTEFFRISNTTFY